MGVTYKLRDEVVQFIISQRQSNPLSSCRQLAESASQKFDLRLSKSSVHDVLKESGITTPRGRKPKDSFKIPQEKKQQIQTSLAQVKLLAPPSEKELLSSNEKALSSPNAFVGDPEIAQPQDSSQVTEESSVFDDAGEIFIKAALWDLGIFSQENIKKTDWDYYLTYAKGVKVVLENNNDFFIEMPLPLERCIRETADGLVNNIRPFVVHKTSNEDLFKACMDAQTDTKIKSILIVDQSDHEILELSHIVERKRTFFINNRLYVENKEKNPKERAKKLFFTQGIDNNNVIESLLKLKGTETKTNDEYIVTLFIEDVYENKTILQGAAGRLNEMYLRDEEGRLLSVILSENHASS